MSLEDMSRELFYLGCTAGTVGSFAMGGFYVDLALIIEGLVGWVL